MITIFNLIGGFGGGPETNIYPQNAPTFSAPDGELIGVLKKIYYETSSDDTNWTLRATLSGTVTGDLRFGFYGNKSGKTIDNAYIQADYGLN